MTRPLVTILSVCCVFAFLALPALAENGKVKVVVFDEETLPFPGATVVLTNSNGTFPKQVKLTGPDGVALFPVVPVGRDYEVKVEVSGFAPVLQGDLSVNISQTQELQVQLSEEFVEKVTVIGSDDNIDLDKGGTQTTTFTDEFIDDLPVLGRDYQSVLTKAPGVNDTDGDGNPNVHGARERDFKATIDGVSNVDPLTGTFMSNINPDAIAEIEVVTSGAGAEYGGATGGFAKVITKSGGNDFEGVFNFFYRTHQLDGNGATDLPKDDFDFERIQPSINFTGPIVKNNLWFALNHEYIKDDDPVILTSGTSVTQTLEGWRHLDKITWQTTARNKLTFTFSKDPLEWGPLNVDNLTPLESAYDYEQGGPTYQLTWNVPYSPTASWEAMVAFSDTGIGWTPVTTGVPNSNFRNGIPNPVGHVIQPANFDMSFDSKTNVTSGSYFQEFDDTRQRWTYQLKGEKFLQDFAGADHNIKAGVTLEDIYYDYDRLTMPFSFFQQAEGTGLGAQGQEEVPGGAVSRQIACATGSTGRNASCEPFQSRAADGIRFAAWVEDSFRPLPNLSIRVGARFQREEYDSRGFVPFDPVEERRNHFAEYDACQQELAGLPSGIRLIQCTRRAVREFTGYENDLSPGRRALIQSNNLQRTKEAFSITNDNISPRFSISWDPWNNAKTKVFGTWGRYYGETFLLPLLAEQGPDTIFQDFDWSRNLTTGTATIADRPRNTTAASVSQVDRNLRTPFSDEWTIGFERELAAETALSVTYINRHFKDQFQDVDVNHEARDEGSVCVRQTDGSLRISGPPDGKFDDCTGGRRPLIRANGELARDFEGNIVFLDEPDGTADLYLHNPFFNQIFLIGNFNSSQYEAVQVQLRRRFYKNWEMEGSYVWSEAFGQAEDYNQGLGDDPSILADEQGPLKFDQTHLVKLNARTILPWWGGFRVGTTVQWESGLPYSELRTQIVRDAQTDYAGSTPTYNYIQNRTIYETGSRNDQRNESFWTVDVNFQKEFTLGPTTWSAQFEVFNMLNNDRLWIRDIQNNSVISTRRFGRRYQVALKVNF